MKNIRRLCVNPLWGGLLVLALVLSGCGGSDGKDGATGPAGLTGPAGPAGAPGTDGVDGMDAQTNVTAINPVLTYKSGAGASYDAGTETLTVNFFLTDGDGNGIDVTKEAYEIRLYASELVPAVAASGSGDAWNQLISERGTPAAGSDMPGTLTLVDADTGEYSYVVGTVLAASTNVNRITMRARWRSDRDPVTRERIVYANPVNASYDFLQSDPGATVASGADMVTTDACQTCHGARIGDVGHGGGYTQVKTCNNCHNVNYMASRDLNADLGPMIHGIHSAQDFSVDDFSEVTYPQDVNTCTTCHAAAAANEDLYYMVPTRRNCGTCHSNVNFETGDNHPTIGGAPSGNIQTSDANCTTCHNESGGGFSTIDVHNPDPSPANTPEFAVAIAMTAPANGEFFVAGETPVVTVTLATGAGAVAGTVYTDDKGAKGASGGALSNASLYVYGPRSQALPVLTTNSTTDGGKQQGHDLTLTGGTSTDARVTTTASGYSYQLQAIPADLAAGTYMVRFEGSDYGGVSSTDYVTASTALINFQVGTADEEHKVSGDACAGCHGETRMHLEGAYAHNAPFNTDQCLGCHDVSGNYADYIGNRVHAVHRASVTGDLKNKDWSEVTFPQDANNCTVCHTNPDPDAPVWTTPDALACGGCHGSNTDLADAMTRFPSADEEQLIGEVAAAVHMEIMGGDYDPTTNPQTSCIVCHGEDRIADLYVTHHLVTYPPVESVDTSD